MTNTGFPLDADALNQFVNSALAEDVGRGDLTSIATIPASLMLKAAMVAREDMVLAGMPIARAVFKACDPACRFEIALPDGSPCRKGEVILTIEGNARALLTAERTALNTLQHLSGIATLTRHYVDGIKHTASVLLDTRKTIPGLRELAKYATRMGGAQNHRHRLDDGLLIKDNHIARAGSITAAVKAAQKCDLSASPFGIEVECDTLDQLREAIAVGADRVLLDNMSLDQLREAVKITAGRLPLEASGGVNLQTIGAIAETGVDYISVGRITQSAPAVDIGLDYLD
jgi:nicotinate-nucleotide pyrophosphorylase (carboxylating)